MPITTLMAETTASVRRPLLQRISHRLTGRPASARVNLPLIAEVLLYLPAGATAAIRVVVWEDGIPRIAIDPGNLVTPPGSSESAIGVVRATLREKGAHGRYFPVRWVQPEEEAERNARLNARLAAVGAVIADAVAEIPMEIIRRPEISCEPFIPAPGGGFPGGILEDPGHLEGHASVEAAIEARRPVHIGMDLASRPDLVAFADGEGRTFTREEIESATGVAWATTGDLFSHPAGPAASAMAMGGEPFPKYTPVISEETAAACAAVVESIQGGLERLAERRALITMAQDHEGEAERLQGMREGTTVAKRKATYAMRERTHRENAAALRRAVARIRPGDGGR